MTKLVTLVFIACSFLLWYFILFGSGGDGDGGGGGGGGDGGGSVVEGVRPGGFFVAATNGHGSPLEGRDIHHTERGGQIRRELNHCWRRYDGYNMQNTIVNKKEQLKKAYGILCNFKCNWLFMMSFPTCQFIYDYKLSCYLFTSLPDCTSVKCTLLNYFS